MSKLVTRRLRVYSLKEARERLAVLTNHKEPSYSRGGFYRIVRKYHPDLIDPVITEEDLESLARKIRKPGRPKKD